MDVIKIGLTHEQVICIWNIASNSKELHQIVELAMNVTTYLIRESEIAGPSLRHEAYCYWCRYSDDVALFY